MIKKFVRSSAIEDAGGGCGGIIRSVRIGGRSGRGRNSDGPTNGWDLAHSPLLLGKFHTFSVQNGKCGEIVDLFYVGKDVK